MGKTLMVLSFVGLMFVMIGTLVMPQDLIFWFTSTTPIYQVVRVALAATLLLQITTHPPRHIVLRVLAGLIGVASGVWVVQETISFHMLLLDCLSLLSASVAVLVTALEPRPVSAAKHKQIPVFVE